ncbi:hypothetical protein Tco_1185307 [Tanacetum coccineum]
MRILSVVSVTVDKWYGYGHLKEIVVRRADQKLYKFMEGDFPRLHLNNIEDMLLLVVQNKLFNLEGDKKLNISKPQTRDVEISFKELYTTHSDPQGVIYEDKLKRKRLMRTDELYKFSDGTLNSVRNTLQQMLLNFRLRYNKAMERRKWTVSDQKRTRIMIKAIDQQLLERRIMRSLEKTLVRIRARNITIGYQSQVGAQWWCGCVSPIENGRPGSDGYSGIPVNLYRKKADNKAGVFRRYDTKGVKMRKGMMQTKTELTLEQTQQVVSDDVLQLVQDKYVKDMLTKFDMESVRTATTPYEAAKTKLKNETDPPVNVHLYRSMIGSLMYLTASRPDIMFAVSACSRHQVTPLTSHLNAVKKIFKYLKGQPKLGLWYPKDSPFQLEAYSDSDYAGSHGDRKSTTEAEYVAAASCCAQVLWIQNQLLDYGFNFMNTKIFIDNQSTICIVKNPVFHQRTKHIEIRHHFIRDANEKNLIQVLKIHTDENVADLLTKAFDGPRFEWICCFVGYYFPVIAGRQYCCWVYILPADRLVSAGSTMILLGVILPAGCLVSAGSYGLCCWFRVHAGRHTSPGGFISADRVFVYAVNTSFYAAELVCAGSIMFLLAELFLLVVTCLCCLNLVSAVLSLILLVGWSLPLVTKFLLVVSIPAGVSMYLLNE